MISVVIPLNNKVATISRTLDSVLRQTYSDFEVIIVDDGSTDGSAEVAARYTDCRFRIVRQPNAGVSAARNRGISEARGAYVAFLDADDEWMPDFLSTMHSLSDQYPQCDVFAVNYQFCNSTGTATPTIIRRVKFQGAMGVLDNYFEVASHSHPPIWSSSVMIRCTAINAVGGFPVGIQSGEDLLTWGRLATRFQIAYCKEAKAVFHQQGYDFHERPKRVPASDDVVGRELKSLADTYHPAHINDYLSHWHKMRSSIYCRLHMRRESIREALKGLRYRPSNLKLYVYILINFLPKMVQPF